MMGIEDKLPITPKRSWASNNLQKIAWRTPNEPERTTWAFNILYETIWPFNKIQKTIFVFIVRNEFQLIKNYS